MPDGVSGPFHRADLAYPRYVTTIPFDAEFEVFVGIKPSCINAELCHLVLQVLYLSCYLLELDHDKLCGFERCKPD